MVSLNDNEIKLLLENILWKSCKEANVASSKYKVILMGKKKKYSTMKSAYYVQVQNFSNTYNTKKSKNNKYFRYYFRIIQFLNRKSPLFEIAKWTPEMGDVDMSKVIYRDDDKRYKGSFQERLVLALKFVNLKM